MFMNIKINDYLLPFLLLLTGITIGMQRQEMNQITPPPVPSSWREQSNINQTTTSLSGWEMVNGTHTNTWKIVDPVCLYIVEDNTITLNTACLKHPSDELLAYGFTGIIEKQRKDVIGFTHIYDDEHARFTYQQANPVWKDTEKQSISQYRQRKIQDIKQWNTVNQQFTLSREERSIIAMDFYAYFTTDRDISEYGSCSARNYYVAAISIDKKFVNPWEQFNVNRRIAYRTGYCKDGDEESIFFGGVCGAATQIFRIGLLHPEFQVVERENHQIRYSKYYGATLWGDDAGIAEFYKKLTLQNNSFSPIYFKYRDEIPGELVGIVAISPTYKYAWLETTIQKEQTGPLEAKVISSSILSWEEYQPRVFTSTYVRIEDGGVN